MICEYWVHPPTDDYPDATFAPTENIPKFQNEFPPGSRKVWQVEGRDWDDCREKYYKYLESTPDDSEGSDRAATEASS